MKHFIALACVIGFCLEGRLGNASQKAYLTDPEAYEVFAAVFTRFAQSAAHRGPLVIRSDTRRRDRLDCVPSGSLVENEWKPVLNDFFLQNVSPHFLDERRLIIDVAVEIVAWSELMTGEDTYDGWKNFRARWPTAGGYYRVSAVGFDETHSRAMVYVGRHGSPVSGEGQYHFLEKIGEWRETTLTDVSVCKGLPFH